MNVKYVRGVLFIISFTSLLIVSEGYFRVRTLNARPSRNIRKYCKGMTWLRKYQRNLCYRIPGMIEVIQKGVERALVECRRQFSMYRWNCTPLYWKEVFAEDGILRKRSPETAFVQAITAASVMMEIAKTCVTEKTKYCGCGSLSRRDRNDVSVIDGCGDNINFGAYLAASFMDPTRPKTHAKKVKRHNHIAGRKIVRLNVQRKCECQSHLTGCYYKVCKRVVPNIEKVGDEIWKLYQNPIRSYWNKTDRRLYKLEKIWRKRTMASTEQLQGKLVYFKKSENFCEPNFSMGIVGTYGRTCNHTSSGLDGCDTMCCGRSYKTTVLTEEVKCNCRFVWCCKVKCETCKRGRLLDSCR